MKTRPLIIVALALVPLSISHVSAMCAAETLQWWEPCNDTGPTNALPLNPMLLSVMFAIVLIIGITVAVIFIIRRKRK